MVQGKGICSLSDFFRFPHTPHLAWLGQGTPRDDKVLSPAEVAALLADGVVVEEKLDGANLGLSLAPQGGIRAQNRGQYLAMPCGGQFARLPGWLAAHEAALADVLTPDMILFGEWCAARHALDYDALPDWFVLFDVCERQAQRFWSSPRRNALAAAAGLTTAPCLHAGPITLAGLVEDCLSQPSCCRQGNQPLEGVVVRREDEAWCLARAKLVRPAFTQAIDEHWRARALQWNRLAPAHAGPA